MYCARCGNVRGTRQSAGSMYLMENKTPPLSVEELTFCQRNSIVALIGMCNRTTLETRNLRPVLQREASKQIVAVLSLKM